MAIYNGKVHVKNYKCFDSRGGGFDKIMPINIIIGKNNSGKSSLIDLVRFVVNDEAIAKENREGKTAEILVGFKPTQEDLDAQFSHRYNNLKLTNQLLYNYITNLINDEIYYNLVGGRRILFNQKKELGKSIQGELASLINRSSSPLLNRQFYNITAERDIIPEVSNNEIKLAPNGQGATNLIQQIINSSAPDKDSKLIETKLLKELNKILNPDIEFSRILVQRNGQDTWEVFFEDQNEVRVALSKMGSGVKTVLLVLLNLIVLVNYHKKSKGTCVFAFEELENNLHPALQRRLYDYIKKYTESNDAVFFITTHSNVVIDMFGLDSNSQLIHIEHDGVKATTKTVLSDNETKTILTDIGVKASDLLQSNGVIWVEGPSDRNYINKWLQLLEPNFVEGLHYSIMFYGGKLLANTSFDYDKFEADLIPMLKINSNAYVVIDRDGKKTSPKLNNTKKRINEELGGDKVWITKCREIENYLSEGVIEKWLGNKGIKLTKTFVNENNTKLENSISGSIKIKLEYNKKKTLHSKEIAQFIDVDSIDFLDLRGQLSELIENIKLWNHIND